MQEMDATEAAALSLIKLKAAQHFEEEIRREDDELIARHAKRMGYPAHKIHQLQTGLNGEDRAVVIANLREIERMEKKDGIISTNLGPNRKARRRKEALAR